MQAMQDRTSAGLDARLQAFLSASLGDEVLLSAVARQYWDNAWLPLGVRDWALRLLIPTLTMQVRQYAERATGSEPVYSAQFECYRAIINRLAALGLPRLAEWTRSEYAGLIGRLGMVEARWRALEGIKQLVARLQPIYAPSYPPSALLQCSQTFREAIKDVPILRGAKVGALAGIYLWHDDRHGYNRFPAIPVDDGMATYLAPGLLGRCATPRALSAYLTTYVQQVDFSALHAQLTHAVSRQASSLSVPVVQALGQVAQYWEREAARAGFADYWFTHLAFIYHKRLTCAAVARCQLEPCGRCGTQCGALDSRPRIRLPGSVVKAPVVRGPADDYAP
jgi:hypothetical protein